MGAKQSSQTQQSQGTTTFSFKLSKNCNSPDLFSIKDNDSGNIFKVEQAGIRFDIIAVHVDPEDKNKRMCHYGLFCDDNKFVVPGTSTEFSMCLIHRIDSNIQVVFSTSKKALYDSFRIVLGSQAKDALISRVV